MRKRATSFRRAVQDVHRWKVWSVKEPLRAYLVAAPVVVGLAVALAAANTHWDGRQALIFVALVGCGGTAIEAIMSPRLKSVSSSSVSKTD